MDEEWAESGEAVVPCYAPLGWGQLAKPESCSQGGGESAHEAVDIGYCVAGVAEDLLELGRRGCDTGCNIDVFHRRGEIWDQLGK